MTLGQERDYLTEGEQRYQRWADSLVADEEGRRLYEHEAAKKGLWLQLVEAREAAGLTQAEVAKRLGVSQAQVDRIEKRGYDACTLNTLRRYVRALGDDFSLQVVVRRTDNTEEPASVPMH